MKTTSYKDEIYIGRGAGKRLQEDIEKAKHSIKIVSPYLTASYVEDLLKKSRNGVDVMLITSNDVEQGDGRYSNFTHRDIVKQKRHTDEKEKKLRKDGMKYSMISLVIPIFLFIINQFIIGAIALVGVGISYYIFYNKTIYSYSYYSPIKLKVIADKYHSGEYLVHAKIFIIDGRICYLGSVNFTANGCKYNYETITRTEDRNAIIDIAKEVDRVFNDKDVAQIDIQKWGMLLYPEPKH